MLEWFELTNVEVKPKENTVTQDTQSEESPVNVIHLYLDENNLTPDNREDLRPNGFTPAKTFHDFPIRGQEVLLHVRRRRWLDTDNHNVMSEFDFIQESTRCSKELADFLKEAFGDAPYNRPVRLRKIITSMAIISNVHTRRPSVVSKHGKTQTMQRTG